MKKDILIKVCGMTQLSNIEQIESLGPAYLGFIFYDKSPRNMPLTSLSKQKQAKRVGVFVNADLAFISEKVAAFELDVVQLHADESADFCSAIKTDFPEIKIWKVFGIKDRFNFQALSEYVPIVNAFLFDTKGVNRGGNGIAFDWAILKDYPFDIPIIISGGIGLEHIEPLTELLATDLPIHAIDLNSKFEISPGIKNYTQLKTFFDAI